MEKSSESTAILPLPPRERDLDGPPLQAGDEPSLDEFDVGDLFDGFLLPTCELPGCSEHCCAGTDQAGHPFQYCTRLHALAGRILPQWVKDSHRQAQTTDVDPVCCLADCRRQAFVEKVPCDDGYQASTEVVRKHGFCSRTHYWRAVERGTCRRPSCHRAVYLQRDAMQPSTVHAMDYCSTSCVNIVRELPTVKRALQCGSHSVEFIRHATEQLRKHNMDPSTGVLEEREDVWQVDDVGALEGEVFFTKVVKSYGGKRSRSGGHWRFTGGWVDVQGSADSLVKGQFKYKRVASDGRTTVEPSMHVYCLKETRDVKAERPAWCIGVVRRGQVLEKGSRKAARHK